MTKYPKKLKSPNLSNINHLIKLGGKKMEEEKAEVAKEPEESDVAKEDTEKSEESEETKDEAEDTEDSE